MEIITREEWGARYGQGGLGRALRSTVYVHTSVTSLMRKGASREEFMREVRKIESIARQRGFSGISYSFLVDPVNGWVAEGRGWKRNGAHTKGYNSTSYAICFVGHGDRQGVTAAGWNGAKSVIQQGLKAGYLPANYRIRGHREVAPKSCPGNLIYPYIGKLSGLTLVQRPEGAIAALGDVGDLVGIWQGQLAQVLTEKITVDGDFGPETKRLTELFEQKVGNTVDGWVSLEDSKAIEKLIIGGKMEEVKHYDFAIRYAANPVDERIARALGAGMHLHTARYDHNSTVGKVYLVGGEAERKYDRELADEVVELGGATRTETIDEVVEIFKEYISTL